MGYERFIARRYLKSGRFFISVATWITILGVMLGVAVVCFVMSMHNGFESEIRTRLLGTTSHISIFPFHGELIEDYPDLIKQVETVEGVLAASPFIYYKAAIASESAGDGIILRGIDLEQERKTAAIAENIKVGEYSFDPVIVTDDGDESVSDTIPGMILGKNLAERLQLFVGQSVALYSLKGEELKRTTRPRVARFYVSGIFETGMYEFDASLAYISLASAQKLFRVGNAVTTVHLKLDDIYKAENMAPIIDSVLNYRYDVVPWNVLHKNLFTWISIEKKILFLGFILIVVVAAFSIISNLVILTMEKRSEIGIMKTIGSTPGSIRKIFVYKGLSIAFIGVLLGWILAVVAAYLQNRFNIISLPEDIYFISYLPIEMHLVDFLLAGFVTFIVCYLAALYPAVQAAKLSVVKVLRQ